MSDDVEVVVKARCDAVGSLETAKRVVDLPREKPSAQALLTRALALAKTDEPAALRLYEQAIRLWGEDPLVLNDAAWLLLTARDAKLRDPRRALPLARKAVELSKEENGNILDTLAVALRDTGDIAGAAKYSKAAAELEPKNAEIVGRAMKFANEAEMGR